jgi:hypothetical protein
MARRRDPAALLVQREIDLLQIGIVTPCPAKAVPEAINALSPLPSAASATFDQSP